MLRGIVWSLVLVVVTVGSGFAQVTVYTSDFIPDAQRSHFNGFNGLTENNWVSEYSEGGIRVQEILFIGTDPGARDFEFGICGFVEEDIRSWTAISRGHTRITREDGGTMTNLGLIHGTPNCPADIMRYLLRYQGAVVDSGLVGHGPFGGGGTQYFGISGGPFDELLLRGDISSENGWFFDTSEHWLSIDSVELMEEPTPVEATTWGRVKKQ